MNDNTDQKDSIDVSFGSVLAYSIVFAFGSMTVLFAPLCAISAHLKLPEPWSKLAILSGSAIALLALRVPAGVVVITFVFSIFVADHVRRGTVFWNICGNALLLAAAAGAGTILFLSQYAGVSPVAYWHELVTSMVGALQQSALFSEGFSWNLVRDLLFYEGPFLFLSIMFSSLWLSIGVMAHVGWVPPEHALSGATLRRIRMPWWISIIFLTLFAISLGDRTKHYHLLSGALRLISSLMFLQGTVFLSDFLARASFRSWIRSIVYSVACSLGFYAVIGMGLISPWFYRQKKRLEVQV